MSALLKGHYGKEVVLDIGNCDSSTFTRESLTNFLVKLCDLIDMEREPLYFCPACLKDGEAMKISRMTLLMEEVSDNAKGGLV